MVTRVSSLPEAGGIDSAGVDRWLNGLGQHRSEQEQSKIRQAVNLVRQLSLDTTSKDKSEHLLALLQATDILDQLQLDTDTLIACLLSDTPAHADFDSDKVIQLFGKAVLTMTKDMYHIHRLSVTGAEDKGKKQTENLRRMLLGLADDVRVVLVVLAKRLQLMRGLKYFDVPLQQAVAAETQRIHAPLANRLGVWQIKWELEDLSLRYLEADQYKDLAQRLESKRQEREIFITEVIKNLRQLCSTHGIAANITGRPKHIFSIWKKMHRKGVNFESIFDVRAVRVLVDTVAQCYEVLGIVHNAWQPIPGEFDDYIARPKANGYSSLHTAVVGDDGKPLEIQIRTHEMHEHAERGVAAHWRYKESGGQDSELERRVEWMRNWLEQQEEPSSAVSRVEDIDQEFEARRIYVLTPEGKVIELPKDATAVDFAYAVHTSVGHRCRGAKADGHIIPLTQALQSGQTIEILTTKEGGPSRDWLSTNSNYIVTARARNRVRQWFKQQDYEQHVHIGRASLDREVTRLSVPRPDLAKLAQSFNFKTANDLLAAIGRGDVSPIQVANVQAQYLPKESKLEIPEKARKRAAKRRSRSDARVIVQGVGDLLTQMAKCCKPVPYDSIIGYITRGRGVTIHRQDCSVVKRMDESQKQRLVAVVWADDQPENAFLVDVKIYASDRKGLLSDISAVFSNAEVDVLGVKTQSDRKNETASMRFTVEVSDMAQLSRLLEKLSQIPDVIEVHRHT